MAQGDAWSTEELRASVKAYLQLLKLQSEGKAGNKAFGAIAEDYFI